MPDKNVFERVLNYYKENIWMTFGQFEYYHNGGRKEKGFTQKPIPFDQLRNMPWVCSHLRTFKAFLFKEIKKESLINLKTNWFWEMAGDVAVFLPMIDLAGKERIKWVDDINYIYNTETIFNEHKVNRQLQQDCFKAILKLQPYEKLEEFDKSI